MILKEGKKGCQKVEGEIVSVQLLQTMEGVGKSWHTIEDIEFEIRLYNIVNNHLFSSG